MSDILLIGLIRLELYEKYKSFTLEGLKDFMRWNKQPIAGTKVWYNECP
jgi:hypothetical protein